MNKIFFNGTHWLGFIAPEKQMYAYIHNLVTNTTRVDEYAYDQAYAEAKRGALPILNPEIIEESNDFPYDVYKIVNEICDPSDYTWPGDMTEQVWRQGYVLSLPNSAKDESKMTAEDLPALKIIEIWRKECPGISFNDAVLKVALKYSDQQLAAYKDSLNKELEKRINEVDPIFSIAYRDIQNTIKKL